MDFDVDEDEGWVAAEEGLDRQKDEVSEAESSDEELNTEEGAAQTQGTTDVIPEYTSSFDVQLIHVF